MKIFFDNSVLVAALVEEHPHHGPAFSWLKRSQGAGNEFMVCSHALVETYAVLTALPVRPKISPGMAWRLINNDIISCAKVVALSSADYQAVLKNASELGLSGGAVYAALIARAAQKTDAECLLTLNIADFKRVWPEGSSKIRLP